MIIKNNFFKKEMRKEKHIKQISLMTCKIVFDLFGDLM